MVIIIVIIVVAFIVFSIMNVSDSSPQELKIYLYKQSIVNDQLSEPSEADQQVIIQSKYITFKGYHNDKLTIQKRINNVYTCKDGHYKNTVVILNRENHEIYLMYTESDGIKFSYYYPRKL